MSVDPSDHTEEFHVELPSGGFDAWIEVPDEQSARWHVAQAPDNRTCQPVDGSPTWWVRHRVYAPHPERLLAPGEDEEQTAAVGAVATLPELELIAAQRGQELPELHFAGTTSDGLEYYQTAFPPSESGIDILRRAFAEEAG